MNSSVMRLDGVKATQRQQSHGKASPTQTDAGTKAHCTSTVGTWAWVSTHGPSPPSITACCHLSSRERPNRRHFSILLALPKRVTTWKKRERLTIAGFWLSSVCVYPFPLTLPLSLALGFVHLEVVSNRNLVESLGNGLLQESEIHSLWLWLSCLSFFLLATQTRSLSHGHLLKRKPFNSFNSPIHPPLQASFGVKHDIPQASPQCIEEKGDESQADGGIY